MFHYFPKQLPWFVALIFGIIPISYIWSGLFFEISFGRPSSTSGVGFIVALIYSLILSFVGYLIGKLIKAIWIKLKIFEPAPVSAKFSSLFILILLIIIPVYFSITRTANYIKKTEPAILADSGILKYLIKTQSAQKIRDSTLLYDNINRIFNTIKWNNNESKILESEGGCSIKDSVTGKTLSLPITGLDYITNIYGSQFDSKHKNNSLLALVISGRATGRRSIFLIISSDYKILYSERFDRSWKLQDNPLAVFLDKETEIGVIGSGESSRSFILLN